jgi:hypothetical protein
MTVAQAQTAPWWGVPLIAGLFTIIGVLTAQSVSWTLDRRKASRESAQRWLTDRRQLYAKFLLAAGKAKALAWVNWVNGFEDDEFREALEECLRLRQEIRLVSSSKVRRAAWDMHQHLGDLPRDPKSDKEQAEIKRDEWTNKFLQLDSDFVTAARADLDADS